MEALANFHFLRPLWLLMLLPFLAIFLVERRRNDQARHWEPVIAAHLLREMIVRGGGKRLFSPAGGYSW